MELSHAPVVQKFSAAHRVPKMSLPTVGGIHVSHGRGNATLRHDGVSFPEKRFADHTDRGALREGFDGGAQSRSTRANDENIVLARLVICSHRSLRSRKVPH